METTQTGEKFAYTLEEVSELTGFALRTLEKECRARRWTHIRKGDTRAMTPDQIRALLDAHTVPAEGGPVPATEDPEAANRRRVANLLARPNKTRTARAATPAAR